MGLNEWLTATSNYLGFTTDSGATKGIATPFNTTESHLQSVLVSDIFPGADLSMLGIDRSNAMKIASAAKARNMIVGAIAGMPLQGYRNRDALELSDMADVIVQPEAGRPRAVTMAWTVDQMLWYGRAWWYVTERLPNGRARHVQLILEQDIDYDPERGTVTVGTQVFPESDFIRIDALHEGVLSFGRDVMTRAALTEMAAAKASNNPVPSIELHQTDGAPMSREEIDTLIARWASARSGKNGGIAYTTPGIETKTHGVAAEQLLIAGRNTAALDVARMMGLPAWAVDASVEGSSLTYSNVPSRSRELLDYVLFPYMDAIAGRLSMDDVLPRGQWCSFNSVRLLKGDFAERMSAGKTAIEAGIYTAEEVRLMESEIPLEG